MDNTLVGQLNQAAIDGIREVGATTQYIFVEGNAWTGAWQYGLITPASSRKRVEANRFLAGSTLAPAPR
jgi:hypothetical protein